MDCGHSTDKQDESGEAAAHEGRGGGGIRAHFTQNVTAATGGGNSALACPGDELPYLFCIIVR